MESEINVEIVEQLLFPYCALVCNTSLKLHSLQSHWDFSREIWKPSLTGKVKSFTGMYLEGEKVRPQMEPNHAG
jgi:hypothetical protein